MRMHVINKKNPIETCLVGDNENEYSKILDLNLPFDTNKVKFEKIESPKVSEPSKLELKTFPSTLRYEILGSSSTLPVTVNVNLDEKQTESLLKILRKHKRYGYSLDDIRINASLCMHKILMEEGSKPSVEYQRRLNSNLKEVLRMILSNSLIQESYTPY